MKKNIVYLIIIWSLAGMNIFLVVREKQREDTKTDPYAAKLLDQELELLLMNERHEMSNEDYPIDSGLIRLCKKGNDRPKLILRLSDLGCSSCIEAQLDMVLKYQEAIGIDNIALLFSAASQGDTIFYKKWKYIKCHTHFINYERIGLPLDKFNMPYYFIIANDSKAKLIHVPSKELPLFTDAYLSNILQRYFRPVSALSHRNQQLLSDKPQHISINPNV